jgi:hypothetical protein
MFDNLSSSKCFISSTRAVALANLARETKSSELMSISRSTYAKAIKDVNIALKSKEVNSNSTLVATLILGLFESITYTNESCQAGSLTSCLESWVAHTNGTVSLLNFRGMDFLQTDFGKELYIHVGTKMRASCARQRLPLPPDFVALDKQMAPLLQGMDPMVQFWPLLDMNIEMHLMNKGRRTSFASLKC